MTTFAPTQPIARLRHLRISLTTMLCALMIVLSFGQPNGLVLSIPQYPTLALVAVLGLMLLIAARAIALPRWTIPATNLTWPLLGFFALSSYSLSYAADASFGLRILVSMGFKVLVFVSIVEIVRSRQQLRRVLLTLALIGTLFALQSIALVVAVGLAGKLPSGEIFEANQGSLEYNYLMWSYGLLGYAKSFIRLGAFRIPRAQGMFIEPGWFASYLELTIFCTLAYSGLTPGRRTLARGMALVQLLALALSFSTAGFIATAIGGLAMLVVRARGRIAMIALRLVGAALLVGLIIAIMAAVAPAYSGAIYKAAWGDRFRNDWNGLTSAEQRVKSITTASELFWKKPWLGWGTNQARIVSQGFGINNAIFTVAAELGIVGLILYSSVLLAIMGTMWRSHRIARRQIDPVIPLATGALIGCVCALIAHSMFVDTNWSFFYWIGIGLLYANARLLIADSSSDGMTNHADRA